VNTFITDRMSMRWNRCRLYRDSSIDDYLNGASFGVTKGRSFVTEVDALDADEMTSPNSGAEAGADERDS
jgi:hypothetical protein